MAYKLANQAGLPPSDHNLLALFNPDPEKDQQVHHRREGRRPCCPSCFTYSSIRRDESLVIMMNGLNSAMILHSHMYSLVHFKGAIGVSKSFPFT